jgi:hypothetical protein
VEPQAAGAAGLPATEQVGEATAAAEDVKWLRVKSPERGAATVLRTQEQEFLLARELALELLPVANPRRIWV